LDSIEYDKILCEFENDILQNYKQSKYIRRSDTIFADDNVVGIDELNKVLSILKALIECGESYKIVNCSTRTYPRTNGEVAVSTSAYKVRVGIVTTDGKKYRFWCISHPKTTQRTTQKRIKILLTPNEMNELLADIKTTRQIIYGDPYKRRDLLKYHTGNIGNDAYIVHKLSQIEVTVKTAMVRSELGSQVATYVCKLDGSEDDTSEANGLEAFRIAVEESIKKKKKKRSKVVTKDEMNKILEWVKDTRVIVYGDPDKREGDIGYKTFVLVKQSKIEVTTRVGDKVTTYVLRLDGYGEDAPSVNGCGANIYRFDEKKFKIVDIKKKEKKNNGQQN